MNMNEVKAIASERGVKPGRLKKGELVRAIQAAEGNNTCFASERAESCGEESCLWREDCQKEALNH